MMRTILVAGLAFSLSACGDAADFSQVTQGALDLGGQALEAAGSAVNTETACMLAGQSEVFCGCVQDSLGPEITGETLETLKNVVGESLRGAGLQAAAETAAGVDPETRDALVLCAATAALQDAAVEAAN